MTRTGLQTIPLFTSFSEEDLDDLAGSLRLKMLGPGAILLAEGEPADRVFIILEGQVEVIKALGQPEERLLTVCGAGEFVGEMGVLNPGQPRTASVRARTPCDLMELSAEDFDRLIQRRPYLALEIARELSQRLRNLDNAVIHDLQLKNQELAQAYADLKAAQAELIEKEKLERELQVAHDIQESILPRELPPLPPFDFGARMLPAAGVGGDFFDLFPLPGARVGLVVGDVCGKGIPASLVMAMTRSLLRPEARRAQAPIDALAAVNAHLLDMNASDLFVTALYGILDRTTREFRYVRAAQEMPILIQPDGALTPVEQGIGQPLGMIETPELEERRLLLPPGSTLLIHTDGAPDALDPGGQPFGYRRLREVAASRRGVSAQALCNHLLQTLTAYRGAAPQHDDITLLAVRSG